MSLITRILPPDEKGAKLTFQEMDNNLYYLQSLGVSGLTFSANTLTITNPTGGTKSVIINTGNTFTGGTVSGATQYTNGLSANTISATTYQNLPLDIRVTGGTYSAGTATFINNTGGTFNVTGFLTGVTDTYVTGGTYNNGEVIFTNNTGGTFNVIGFYTGETSYVNSLTTGSGLSADTTTGNITIINTDPDQVVVLNDGSNINVTGTYPNFTIDVTGLTDFNTYTTGFTYSNNTFTILDNSGNTFDSTFTDVTGLTVNGNLHVTGNTNIVGDLTANTISANTLNINGVNITGDTYVTGLTFNTGNYNLTIGRNDGVTFTDSLGILGSDLRVTGGTYDIFTGNATFTNNSGATFIVSGFLVGYTDLLVTGATYSNNTFTFKNSSGGTFDVSFNTVTGLTSTGTIQSSILSATTYQNLPDNVTGNYLPLSGGTVIGSTNFTNGLTANTISATTYQNLPTDVRVTGSTYENNTFTYTNNTGGTFDVLFNSVTGLTINGDLTVTGTTSSDTISATTYQNLPDNVTGNYLHLSGGTVTGQTSFTNGLNTNTISATTYQNLPDNVTGNYLPLSGGTVTGSTYFTNGLTANTISATTYQNLPLDIRVTGGTYSTGTITFTNNQNNTFSVTGLTEPFTGGSGNCITDLYTTNIHSCSPLRINPLNEGNVYFGSTSGVTIDVTNGRLGVGISSPSERLDVSGKTKTLTLQVTSGAVPGYVLTSDVSGNATWQLGGSGTFTGGTVVGPTSFLNGLTANTISATTYQNLPINITITGATYSNNTFTHRNNTGGTYTVLFNTVTGLTVNGNLTVTGTTSSNTISATTYQNLPTDVRVTGATYSNNNFTFTNNTGGTYTVLFNTVTGLTVNGNLNVTGITISNTISATTYQNLPTDVRVTGATYSNNTFTYRNNTGGTFNVLFNTVTGLTSTGTISSNTISATTYQNLPTDITITGATYSNNTFTHRNNTGGTYTVLFNTVTGLTSTGTISSNTISATTYQNLPTDVRVTGATYSNNTFTYTNNTGGTYTVLFNTVTGLTSTGAISSNTISATTYQNLPTDVRVTGATYSNNNFTFTNNTGGTYTVLFNSVTGLTSTGTISSNTISATTYQNLPTDVRVTGGTYSNGTTTFTNNTGGTFNVTGFTTGVTITNNTNNYLLTATGTANSINGEGNATFDGTTLDLKKNSTNPNIILSDTGGTSNDAYIRFESTSAGTPSFAFGSDKSDSNKLKITYSTTSTANLTSTEFIGITTGGTMTIGEYDSVQLTPSGSSGRVLLKNGFTSPTLETEISQYSNFATITANQGTSTANEEFIIVNESVSGATIFRSNTSEDKIYIYPSTQPLINGDSGVRILNSLLVNGTVTVGTVSGSGVAVYRNASTGVLSTTSSDIRLKQNVSQITGATEIIKNLTGVYFDWKDNEDFKSGDNNRQIGLIAQDVEPHLPEAVVLNGNKDYKTVKYSEMVSVLIEGIKEQQQQIDLLKTEIQDLKNRISNIGG